MKQEVEMALKIYKFEADGKMQMMTDECQRLNNLVDKRNNEVRALGG